HKYRLLLISQKIYFYIIYRIIFIFLLLFFFIYYFILFDRHLVNNAVTIESSGIINNNGINHYENKKQSPIITILQSPSHSLSTKSPFLSLQNQFKLPDTDL